MSVKQDQSQGTSAGTVVSGTVTVTQATGTNLHAVLDSTSTTAVTQATGTNLHAVLDSGTLTTVSTVTNLSQQGGVAISLNTGTRDTGTQRITVATDDLVPVKIASGQVNSGAIASGAVASGAFASGAIGSGAIASGAVASGAVASGAFASGSIASGALASGSIAAGAIANGATSIAENEDVASADGDRLVKVAAIRDDTLNARSSTEGDYEQFHLTAEGGLWSTQAGTATPNGLLVGNFTSGDTYTALTNTAQVIKASAGNFYGYYYYNPNAAATYILIYNIAAASVTVGTSTATLVFCVPATSGANMFLPIPIPFSNAGWSIAAATTGGGNTAPATAMEVMVYYL